MGKNVFILRGAIWFFIEFLPKMVGATVGASVGTK